LVHAGNNDAPDDSAQVDQPLHSYREGVAMSRRVDVASGAAGYLGLAVSGNHSGVGPASMARLHATALAELERHVKQEGTHDRGTDITGKWPVRDFLELGALPGAVPSARLHARQIVWEWALTTLTEPVEQVVSELITNSVAAARAMPQIESVRLWLLSDMRKIVVLVWDANPQPPALIEAGDDAESGRGLFLVQAFSERWGSYPTPQMGGKVVWALCSSNWPGLQGE
jgi:anti-sigma regulatory factor (Ser/Thr protein kinase)